MLSRSVVSDSLWPQWTIAGQAPLSMGILQARILEWIAMPSSMGSSNPGIEPRSPALQADSLPDELPRKPQGSLGAAEAVYPSPCGPGRWLCRLQRNVGPRLAMEWGAGRVRM